MMFSPTDGSEQCMAPKGAWGVGVWAVAVVHLSAQKWWGLHETGWGAGEASLPPSKKFMD